MDSDLEILQRWSILSLIRVEQGCVLEVFNAIGESIDTIAVPISAIEVLRSDEILSVRPLAKVS